MRYLAITLLLCCGCGKAKLEAENEYLRKQLEDSNQATAIAWESAEDTMADLKQVSEEYIKLKEQLNR